MNRKQRIIVSITGILLIGLILGGLTYAYYLTKIQGNSSAKSVSLTTAKLELNYADGNGMITASGLLPDTTIASKSFTVTNTGNSSINYAVYLENIINTLSRTSDLEYNITCTSSKTNTDCNGIDSSVFPTANGKILTNTIAVGETQSYVLNVNYLSVNADQSADMGKKIEAKVNIYALDDVVDIIGNVSNYSSGDYVEIHSEVKTSQIDSSGKFILPAVEPGTHTVYLKSSDGTTKASKNITINKKDESVVVDDTTANVSDITSSIMMDMDYDSSSVNLDIEIKLVGDNKLYSQILSNAYLASASDEANGIAVYRESPTTTVAEETSASTEASLSKTEDYNADGTQNGYSYYFRGNVENNYVTFAGMCWRVVRIDGSGNVKIILEDQDEVCSSSMTGNWDIPITTGGSDKTGGFGYENYTAYKNFQIGVLSSYLDKLASGNWCYDDKAYTTETGGTIIVDKSTYYANLLSFYYDSRVRLYGKSTKEPTLKCNGTILNKYSDNTDMYVATLTADEIVYAGGKVYIQNQNYYLINNWQKSNSKYFWSLSPDSCDGDIDDVFYVLYNGNVSVNYVSSYFSFRPTVTLKSSITVTGSGIKTDPYIVS